MKLIEPALTPEDERHNEIVSDLAIEQVPVQFTFRGKGDSIVKLPPKIFPLPKGSVILQPLDVIQRKEDKNMGHIKFPWGETISVNTILCNYDM